VQIAAGAYHACVLRRDGTVSCWGENADGELGDGTNAPRRDPSVVVDLASAVGLRAGRGFTCAWGKNVACWGQNARGALGDGTTIDRFTAVSPSAWTDVVGIATGGGNACALRAGGDVLCWGSYGRPDGRDATRPEAVALLGGAHVVEIAAGGTRTCARAADGSVQCWGERRGPAFVDGLTSAAQIAVGLTHACALRSDRTVACWGTNDRGQLGDGSRAERASPVAVTGVADAVEVAAGDAHTCARRSNGAVACWGADDHGQLGDGKSANEARPVAVLQLDDAVQLSLGVGFSCALRATGEAVCWGAGHTGQLGDGQTGNANFSQTPRAVLGLDGSPLPPAPPPPDDGSSEPFTPPAPDGCQPVFSSCSCGYVCADGAPGDCDRVCPNQATASPAGVTCMVIAGHCVSPHPIPGDRCAGAPALKIGDDNQGTTLAAHDDYAGRCGGQGSADVAYRLDIASPSRLHVDGGTVLALRRSCTTAPTDELACGSGALDAIVDQPGTYFLVVDGDRGSAGGFVLTYRRDDLTAFARAIAQAPALVPGQTVHGDDSKGVDLIPGTCSPGTNTDVAFPLHLAQRGRVVLSVASDRPAAVRVRRRWTDPTSELCSRYVRDRAHSVVDTTLDPGDYAVIVDASGDFDLTYQDR
jgi:hypothetical protein